MSELSSSTERAFPRGETRENWRALKHFPRKANNSRLVALPNTIILVPVAEKEFSM
jgi:hypothetical protein